jgi:hypothetical protein
MGFRVFFWGLVILVLLLLVALPTIMFLAFAMLPAIVAAIIDRTDEKSATFCVGGLNLCGAFPYLLELWLGDNSLDQAIELLTNSFVLAVMYGGAGMGWMLFLSLPPVVASFIQVMSQRRLQQLRKTQKDIIEEWGEEVIMDADLGDGPPPNEPAPSKTMAPV